MKYRDTYRIVTQVSRYVSRRDFRYRATPSCDCVENVCFRIQSAAARRAVGPLQVCWSRLGNGRLLQGAVPPGWRRTPRGGRTRPREGATPGGWRYPRERERHRATGETRRLRTRMSVSSPY